MPNILLSAAASYSAQAQVQQAAPKFNQILRKDLDGQGQAVQETLVRAWKNLDRETKALHSYEVRGRAANGKVREVRVSTDGKVLEME